MKVSNNSSKKITFTREKNKTSSIEKIQIVSKQGFVSKTNMKSIRANSSTELSRFNTLELTYEQKIKNWSLAFQRRKHQITKEELDSLNSPHYREFIKIQDSLD